MRTYFAIGMAILAAGLFGPAAFGQSAQSGPRNAIVVNGRAPYLGIGVQDIDADRAKALKLKETRGAEVTSIVDDSPAAKAGFKEGDVVLDYNGQAVEGGEQLSRLVRETPVGRQVKIGVWRAGASVTLSPTVEARKGAMSFSSNGSWTMPNIEIPMPNFNMPDIEIPRLQPMYQSPMLGIEGESLGQEEQLADFFGVKDGVLVKAVTRNSAADKAGIKAGDVIVKIDDSRVTSTREITSVLRSVRGKTSINVTVVRSKKEMTLPVTLEAAMGPPVRARARLLVPGDGPLIRFSLPIVRILPLRLQLLPQDRVI
ncbi:MAG: PDZ domain-containing protein [Bryobacteraceae bacterium]